MIYKEIIVPCIELNENEALMNILGDVVETNVLYLGINDKAENWKVISKTQAQEIKETRENELITGDERQKAIEFLISEAEKTAIDVIADETEKTKGGL